MALYEEYNLENFPYKGAFYTYIIDNDAPLDERVPQEVMVFETICDIQKLSARHNYSLLAAGYTIYFPLELNPNATGTIDKYGPIKVRRGMTFKGEAYGNTYVGTVEIIRPSQLGACSVDIKVNTESK